MVARCSSILRVDAGQLFVAGSSALCVGEPLVFALLKLCYLESSSLTWLGWSDRIAGFDSAAMDTTKPTTTYRQYIYSDTMNQKVPSAL